MMSIGPTEIAGIVSQASPFSASETVDRLVAALEAAGATLFTVIDQSGEAERVGLSLRETKVLIFGNPSAGTPIMAAAPLAALDLPLKILVWADDRGAVWMSCLSAQWLAERHGLSPELAKALAAPERLSSLVATAGRLA